MPDEKAEKKKVSSGTHCVCKINNKTVAYGSSTRVTERYTMTPVKVQGELGTIEFVPEDYDVSVSIARLFVPDLVAADIGLFPKKGATTDEHLENVAALPPASLIVFNKVTGKAVCRVEGFQLMEVDWTNARGGLVSEDLSAGAIQAFFGSEV